MWGRVVLAAVVGSALAGAAVAQSPPPPKVVSPLTVPAPGKPDAVVDVASDDETATRDFVAIWPASAYYNGADGLVTLSCFVDTHGLAERCSVASESPAGKGFGKAALELRPTFKLAPAEGPDGQPVAATMTLRINFCAPKKFVLGTRGLASQIRSLHDTQRLADSQTPIAGNPIEMHPVTMVDDPLWVAAASFEDLAAAYPAEGGGVEGYGVAHCQVETTRARAGWLRNCGVIKEDPHDRGFAEAALSLTAKFRIDPAVVARAPRRDGGLWVDIPIRMPPPGALADREVGAPTWLVAVDPRTAPKVFPPEAVASGLTTGRGVARCTVGPDGVVGGCAPAPGEPDGLGFSEAAVKLATGMRMNLWSADGAPVDGGVVTVPIRLNLKGGAD